LAFSSCKKDDDPSEAIITVMDSTSLPVAGASVKLTSINGTGSNPRITDTQVTDASGQTKHSFEKPATFDVIVSKDGIIVQDAVRLIEGQTVERVIILE
jgi:hypothetical protein